MESPKKLVCSSSARLLYQEALKVQAWSKDIQRVEGNCLIDGYVSSLSEEVHVDLSQNKLTELAGLWELVSGPNKRKFYDLYGQIASLITVEVDEPLIKAAIQFWDPSLMIIDFFEQVQNHANPLLAIVAETIRSLNICRRKLGERFMR